MTEFVEWNGKRWYPYEGYWKNRAGKLLHREVYMAANGYIPPSVDIHHIDGDRNILTSVSIALEAEGYRITTYTDGASALDGFKTAPPDLGHP